MALAAPATDADRAHLPADEARLVGDVARRLVAHGYLHLAGGRGHRLLRERSELSRFPEIRVTRDGAIITDVTWEHDSPEKTSVVELTNMRIVKVETEIEKNAAPEVRVTFQARLVEVES